MPRDETLGSREGHADEPQAGHHHEAPEDQQAPDGPHGGQGKGVESQPEQSDEAGKPPHQRPPPAGVSRRPPIVPEARLPCRALDPGGLGPPTAERGPRARASGGGTRVRLCAGQRLGAPRRQR
jgi:hypothetical protein